MHITKLRLGLIIALTAPVGFSACEDGTLASRAVPGTLTVSLETFGGAMPGAVTLTVGGTLLGPPVSADRRYQVFVEGVTPSSAIIAVVGAKVSGPLIRIDVPDITDVSAYNVRIIEMVDAQNEPWAVDPGYRLVIDADASPTGRRADFGPVM